MDQVALIERFDFIVFGVTGYTGLLVVEDVARVVKEEQHDLTWAVAGRSERKVKDALEEGTKNTGIDITEIPIVIADLDDPTSLDNMAKRCKVLLNCVGPYRLLAPPVIEACIANGTHHIDATVEYYYLEKMQLDYHEQAKKNNSYVLGAAGFVTVPSEMGVNYLMKHFEGQLHSVTFAGQIDQSAWMYVRRWKDITGGAGTFPSVVHAAVDYSKLGALRRLLYPKPLPKRKFPPPKWLGYYNLDLGSILVHWPGPDKSVIYRGQRYNYEHRGMRPIMFQPYARVPNEIHLLLYFAFPFLLIFAITLILVYPFLKIKFVREVVKKNYRIITFGRLGKGPERHKMHGITASMIFIGRGYKDRLSDPDDEFSYPPDKEMVVKLQMPDHGYISTAKCMVQTALTVLRETDKLPETGGVYTIGSALLNTTMLERCQKHCFSFSVMEK